MASQLLTAPSASLRARDSQFTTVNLSSLRVDAVLHHPVLDERNVLLLAAGSRITTHVLQQLERRGIRYVKLHCSEMASCSTGRHTGSIAGTAGLSGTGNSRPQQRRLSAESSRNESQLVSPVQYAKYSGKLERHGDDPYDAVEQRKYLETFEQSKSQIDSLFTGIDEFRREHLVLLEGVSETSLRQIARDMDLFLALGIAPDSQLYPAQHSLQTAMLALAIGTTCGLSKHDLISLGIGCLAHDAGMLDIDQDVVQSERSLDPLRFLEITKHPGATFDKLRGVQQLAGSSRLVVYQMHERMNGTGYPRQRSGNQIHQLSRIAAVADVFVALISPRPHRPGMLPYYALEHLLYAAKNGQFDPKVVRALLDTVSLFPLGSYVELNDGRVGRVLRANAKSFTRPTLEVWNRTHPTDTPEIISLSRVAELSIIRPLRGLELPTTLDLTYSWE